MSFGPLGIWEIIAIVGVALLIFGPTQLPKIARGVGKAVKSARDFKDEMTGAVLDDEAPERTSRRAAPQQGDATAAAPAAAAEDSQADAARATRAEEPSDLQSEPKPAEPAN